MSDMNVAPAHKQAPRCSCGMTKMMTDDRWSCINCSSKDEPKTGHTIVISEPQGKDGPVKIERVGTGTLAAAATPAPQLAEVEAEIQKRTNTIMLHVPVSLFPDLVIWARKLKLPKDWTQAAKIKAITDFQVDINNKLEDLSK